MKTISTDELKEAKTKQGGLPVINVLPETQFKQEHIDGSRNIPLDTDKFESEVEKAAGSKQAPVVVYCANDACDMSTKAARTLEDAGFQRVYDYEGGTEAWKQAGLPIESKS